MFTWIDWISLIFVLVVSSGIGIYYGCYGSKQSTVNEYLFGGRKMSIIPTAISVAIGHISAVAFIGIPADLYKYGAFCLYSSVAVFNLTLIAMFVFYPIFYKLQITNAYEFLEKRFDGRVRTLGSLFYIIYENLQLPVIAFGPPLALSLATGINVNLITTILYGTCIFYTTIGGLKTVIWTDLFQCLVIIGPVLLILIKGSDKVGGFSSAWNVALEGGRLDIFEFNLDPTIKDSFWINMIGITFRFLYDICLSQGSVQKYMSLPTFRACFIALGLGAISYVFLLCLAVFLGIIVYANFADCDPVLTKQIQKIDQIVPYFVSQVTNNLPGVNGLFIAALVSLSLSTISSSLNSLTTVICNDFVLKFFSSDITEKKSVFILKLVVVIQGAVLICLAFLVPYLGDMAQLLIGITGLLDGPSVGLFTLAALFPNVSAKGAFYGAIGGQIVIATIYFPSMYYKFKNYQIYPTKNVTLTGCEARNITIPDSITFENSVNTKIFFLFRISVIYYCFIGAVATILFAVIITRFTKNDENSKNKAAETPLLLGKQNVS